MPDPDIVISEFLDEQALAGIPDAWEVLYDPALVEQPEQLLAAVGAARALVVRNRTRVRGELLAAARALRVVGRLGVGLDNIDLEACRARDIAVCPATGANDAAVAEYVLTAALVLLRGAWAASAAVAAGTWPRNALMGRELGGKQLGLVGFGAIARDTARRALALGVRVAAHDPYVAPDDPAWSGVSNLPLRALLQTSDVLSLHVPLNDDTRNLLDAQAIALMKQDAVLINAARGGVVDETALVEALRRRRLGGAALDVFAEEPLDARRGALFRDVDNLILTPHIAGITSESNLRVSRVTIANVLRHLEAPPSG